MSVRMHRNDINSVHAWYRRHAEDLWGCGAAAQHGTCFPVCVLLPSLRICRCYCWVGWVQSWVQHLALLCIGLWLLT